MNINPLKKDDNTDALVKALEDANNNMSQGVPAATDNDTPSVDPAVIASDPQINPQAAVSKESSVEFNDSGNDIPEVLKNAQKEHSSNKPIGPVSDTPANNSSDTQAKSDHPGNQQPMPATPDQSVNQKPAAIQSQAAPKKPESSDLESVKVSALEQLRPLIEKIDLEPADKFDKYLMMLRASDDPALIKPAFDAAQAISGEQQRAQALLDIINEINYITANQ